MLFYDLFYRNFGIRRAAQLLNPPLPPLAKLELPRSSILHYTTESALDSGPAADDFLFRHLTRPIQLAHVVENGNTLGHPRRMAIAADTLIRKYHSTHKRFRRMLDLQQGSKDPMTLVVYNYGFIEHLYRYTRSYYSDYYKWVNTESAVWKTIGQVAQESERNQFVVCKLPQILPSIADMKLGSTGVVSQRLVQRFHNPQSLLLLELWKWCGPDRATSMLAAVPDKFLGRVNLVFQESGHWFVVNLGILNSWRLATEMELQVNPEAPQLGIKPDQMQRRFLRLMVSLMHVRTLAAPEVDHDTEQTQTPEQSPAPSAPELGEVQVIRRDPTLPKDDGTGALKGGQAQTATSLPELARDSGKTDTAADVVKSHTLELDARIDADLAELERIAEKAASVDGATKPEEHTAIVESMVTPATLEDGVMAVCDRLADQGMLSAAEYRRYQQLSLSYKKLPAPDASGHTLETYIQVPKETLEMPVSPRVPDISTVVDKSMLKSSLMDFDQRYIKHVMHRDVAGMVLNLQHAGIAVTNYHSEHVQDILGSYHDFTVRVVPVEGAASTFRFKLPAVDEDGTYTANGVKYRLRKQRGDLPIRKIGPDRVALTSYYGKSFVSRSSKRVNDWARWLCNQVMAKGLDAEDTLITELHPGNVFDNAFVAPRAYSSLSMNFRSFRVNPKGNKDAYLLCFDHSQREKLFGTDALRTYEKRGAVVVGQTTSKQTLVMDRLGSLYIGEAGVLKDLGSIEEILGLEAEKAPVDFAEIKVLGRTIPIGVLLGYELGLTRLMKAMGVTPRRVPAGQRANMDESEYALVFSDETLIFSRENHLASMVLAGFGEYHRAIRVYSVYEFDRPGVYLNVLEADGPSARYLREIDLLYRLFVDPITRDLLIEMKEPTDFRGLLLRACEMLLTDHHPDELDPAHMRIKGYERMAGAVYSEMVRSVRAHAGRVGRAKAPIDLNPYAVWKAISQDPSVNLVADINPIENLKQVEAVTYAGVGGRTSRSMTKHTRAFHPNDMGTISESTVDSSDVGISTFTSADPQFTSLRGMSRRYQPGKSGATALLSTSALVSVGSDRDDPKRVNFIGIQQKHTIACSGYSQMPVRTGYEQMIAHRTSDLFAYTAKKPGKVIKLSAQGMIVQYDDGETKGFELGRRYGAAEGLTIPHEVRTELREGQAFKEGDLLTYNPGFFERDILNPHSVVWKAGIVVRTALMESTQTLEDSSAISAKTAALLTTKVTKVKNVVVNFDQSVRKLVAEGQHVDSEDILCIIEDAVTANSGLFDEESLDTLRVLSAQTPQAKAKGVVERVEIYYHGDRDDMSQSLRELAGVSDRELAKRCRAAGKPPYSGSVDDGFRIDGDPLQLDTLCIRIYITADVAAGVGDKGVFCNQMKTVFGEVMTGEVTTESGKEIGAIFGQKSIADRIVLSPEIIGTTTTLLDVIGKKAVAAYRGHK